MSSERGMVRALVMMLGTAAALLFTVCAVITGLHGEPIRSLIYVVLILQAAILVRQDPWWWRHE